MSENIALTSDSVMKIMDRTNTDGEKGVLFICRHPLYWRDHISA